MEVRNLREGVTQHFCYDTSVSALDASLVHSHIPNTSGCRDEAHVDRIDDIVPSGRTHYLLQHWGQLPATVALHLEMMRHEVFQQLVADLHSYLREAAAERSAGNAPCSILTRQALEELPERWVLQSLNGEVQPKARFVTVRTCVTPLDGAGTPAVLLDGVGGNDTTKISTGSSSATDEVKSAPTGLDVTLHRVADMSGGEYWVEVQHPSWPAPRRVAREMVRLKTPRELFADPLIPCDEAVSLRGTSTCVYLSVLLGCQKDTSSRRPGGPSSADLAKKVSLQLADAAYNARRALARSRDALVATNDSSLVAGCVDVEVSGDCVRLHIRSSVSTSNGGGHEDTLPVEKRGAVEVLARTVKKLAAMWDARVARRGSSQQTPEMASSVVDGFLGGENGVRQPTSSDFVLRLTTMLLRYRSCLGEQGYNQGPHAAVPPSVLGLLQSSFDITAEAFASPLNAQLSRYGSLFPDTDSFFGSCGSFFDLDLRGGGHWEVNPPFDSAVIERLADVLLRALTTREDGMPVSLLFAVVLPSHDLSENEDGDSRPRQSAKVEVGTSHSGTPASRTKPSAERRLRESPFCIGQVLCAAESSAYIDGHQHLLRAPLFCIGTPTRIILLGNDAARRRYPDGARRLLEVQEHWHDFTARHRAKS